MAGYSGDLVGNHASIQTVRRLVTRVARSPTHTILIYGETGTGKGLVAHMIHEQSARAGHAFVDVNCAAIPRDLMESELFGHERGAFTGAQSNKPGLVETANGGTIFLDEIRELDLVLQAKLLSVLDTRSFRRVGAVRPIEVDVRFIAATNRILFGEVKEGRFREDLYYRLQVVSINIPPLCERGEDVLVLAEHFIRKLNGRYDRTIRGIEPAVREVFLAYRWPGNVRELEHALERVFALEDEDEILVKHLPPRIMREVEHPAPGAPAPGEAGEAPLGDFRALTAEFQRGLILRALQAAGGNHTAAAERLGLSRHALRHQMQKLHLL